MDDDVSLLLGVIGFIIFGLPLALIMLLPTWFVLFSNWDGYLYWMPWSIAISRFIYAIAMILYPLVAITHRKVSYAYASVDYLVLAIWGMPVLKKSLILLVMTPLNGLELQRIFVTVIAIYLLSISASITTKKSEGKNSEL